ncbi:MULTISPECIES: DUF2259 domain-containing protein [unclassified Roseitalea]|uniref:DUF2259 domain-containing protein n=1 Tax=unclassified Roseitalea TaxID=2639107 RepID=UPI00273DB933|nr:MULTISPECIES: DUF2259 domain-containing protein [unclassified Roseitalea]
MITTLTRAAFAAAIAAPFAALSPAPALAGDAARLNVLGFSADASIFAFEEYGIQDGSGFPYANRFYIDTATDTFLAGTPIRVRLDDEAADVAQARAMARDQGEAIVGDDVLADNRGWLAGFNAVTERSADPFVMTVNPRPVFPPIDDPIEVRLEELGFVAEDTCAGVVDTLAGFRLVAIDPTPGGTTRLLHEDDRVPASRGCPLGYRIGGIQVADHPHGPDTYAVLIAVRSYGFEGPDHRWMAVTVTGP